MWSGDGAAQVPVSSLNRHHCPPSESELPLLADGREVRQPGLSPVVPHRPGYTSSHRECTTLAPASNSNLCCSDELALQLLPLAESNTVVAVVVAGVDSVEVPD